ncbi:ATP-dependent DNA helicase Pif1 [Rhizophagus clarus]|uniref:ATP-dependent DNA helicase Pif1 n=1 Tax=Rhizophagus clarus TaxID=94130 RepID=A0A8H3LXA4_9GLOM|nr:ATP-dependent DNA helicase Pif1 [Rhizophagus clarus]
MLNDNSSKNIAEGIIEQISDADNFNWRFHDKYNAKSNHVSFRYKCSQRSNRAKKSQKCLNPEKQSSVNVVHEMLYELPKEVSVFKCVKDFINENIDLLPKEIYARLMENENLPKSDLFLEFGIDATYNTNNLDFKLYVIHAEVNGAGFPLAYLYLKHNGKCDDGIRTEIITKFVLQLKKKGLDPEFILTDKNWMQIKVCHSIWPNAKIQLCYWHINRAITMRLQFDQIVT